MTTRTDPLLSPDNHVLLMIDHQIIQTLTIRSHEQADILNNVAVVGEAAEIFNIPLLLSVGFLEKQSVIEPFASIVKDAPRIERTTLNSWEDSRITDWVKKHGRPKIVMAGQWTEVCLQFPVISALADGYDVYFIADASGGGSKETHDLAVMRMVQAGAKPLSALVYLSELQRDWAREATANQTAKVFADRGGAFGLFLIWQQQILGLKEGTR